MDKYFRHTFDIDREAFPVPQDQLVNVLNHFWEKERATPVNIQAFGHRPPQKGSFYTVIFMRTEETNG